MCKLCRLRRGDEVRRATSALQDAAFVVTLLLPRLPAFAPGMPRDQAQGVLVAALQTLQAASLVAAHPDPRVGIPAAAQIRCGEKFFASAV